MFSQKVRVFLLERIAFGNHSMYGGNVDFIEILSLTKEGLMLIRINGDLVLSAGAEEGQP
ncbi:hypothetical protein [Burkholderia gladioli]|uniref:hypothetical protein n=1 Tax=Burkholderia gladioli TaxID=28095 RepID=UPI003D1A1C29